VAKPTQSEADRLAAEELERNPVSAKGRATPTRREREAARKRPLVAGKSPEARRASRAASQTQRERARVGMANGEEKYLPIRDRGPQKRYVRDYVDARFSFGELAIPVVAVLLVTEFLAAQAQAAITVAVYGYFLLVIIDSIIMTIILGRKLGAKFGVDRVEKYRWYAVTRAIQFRALRLPKPQVKRRQFPS
jgi:hypothetical protein